MSSDNRKLNWAMIGVMVALVAQAVTLVFGGGGLDSRVVAFERAVVPLSDGTLARLDESTATMKNTLARIERREEARDQ